MDVKNLVFGGGVLRKIVLLILLLLIAVLVFGPTTATPVAAGSTITYNIWATDGFISLADGTQVYMYGFIGGRATEKVTYQNSVVAPPLAPKTYVPGGLVTGAAGTPCTGNWPTPTGGPANACETQLMGNAQFPAPLIYAAVGDTVIINFKNLGVTDKNAPNDPHSIHLHGMDVDAANDGVPETSVGAVPASLAAPGAGNVIVYMFSPAYEGTYMYHCHQEADIHVQMGMYGALVVYNPTDAAYTTAGGGPGKGLGGNLWGWKYDKDYIMLLSEIDVRQHVSEMNALGGGAAFNPINFQPQYWFINGLSFPNTIHASAVAGPGAFNWSTWIAAHPNYDPLITGLVANGGQKVLIRVINMGFESQPMHMHGFHGKILGSDQRAWTAWNQPGNVWGVGEEKQTLLIGSGETYEWLVNFGLQQTTSNYPPDTQSRYTTNNGLPAKNTNTANPEIPVPNVPGVSYIGGPKVFGTIDNRTIPSQIFPFHNHDDYKATNNGVYPGGQFTVLIPLQ